MSRVAFGRSASADAKAPSWLEALEALPLAIGLAFLMCFALTAAIRLQSPFPLGQLDLGFLQHVRRVLNHSTVYPAPTVRFVPLQYTPLYYYVSAAVATFVGEGFLPLRLVSIASTLWSMVVIGAFVRRETGDLRMSVLAACLFSATYRAAGAWFDIPNTDMLRLALGLSAGYVLRFGAGSTSAVLGAALMVLAVLAKQSALVGGLWAAAAVATMHRRRAVLFLSAFVASVALSTLAMIRWESAWYPFYVFWISTHQSAWDNLHDVFSFFSDELLGTMPIALLLPCVPLFASSTGDRRAERAIPDAFYLVGLAGAIVSAVLSKGLQGSGANATIPVFAWLAVIFGITLSRIRLCVSPHVRCRLVVTGLALAQFLMLAYVPASLVPTGPNPATTVHLVAMTPHQTTPVRVVESGNDHLGTAFGPAVEDLLNGGTPAVRLAFRESVVNARCDAVDSSPMILDASIVSMVAADELPACGGSVQRDTAAPNHRR
jgi:hypothetical protein